MFSELKFIKTNACQLLTKALSKNNWKLENLIILVCLGNLKYSKTVCSIIPKIDQHMAVILKSVYFCYKCMCLRLKILVF